ncbi:MAG: hypothetical protein PHQ36_11320, partial [Anaerolineales bacterium]|nr:hypothetical protein [Anaerolineales bacterium]
MEHKINRREFLSAAALTVFVVFLTYGILIPQLGFYRDDWYMLLAGQGHGSAGLIALFQTDRPFIGYLYAIYFRLLGTSPLGWHIFALVVKMAGGVSFLWFARLLFPQHKTETLLLTLLYVVYPGFLQQPVAATYIHLLVAVTASLFSFALTASAVRSQNPRAAIALSVLASILTLFYLLIFESMIGLEAARLFVIAYLLMQTRGINWKSALKRTFQWALPYLFSAGAFFIWRVFIFKATRRSTDLDALLSKYSVSPLRSILTIFIEMAKDFFEMVFQAWTVPLYQFTVGGDYVDLIVSLALAALTIGAILIYLRYYRRANEPASEFPSAGLWLGGLIALFALLPINLAGRNIIFADEWDRYTLHAALGSVLLMGGLIFGALRDKARIAFLLALIAVGAATQFHSAAYYRDFWNSERALWRQLSWRAPALKNGTLLYARLAPGFGFFEDYEIYGPANLIYTPNAEVRLAADLINAKTIPLLIKQEVRGNTNRGVYVRTNYKNALILVFPEADSCLHVIDGRKIELPDFSQRALLYLAPYAKIERIETLDPSISLP